MVKNIKPKWEKPRLVILIRGKPEEMVLAACKMSSGGPKSACGTETSCRNTDVCPHSGCSAGCQNLGSS